MSYRDDGDAALERIKALERDVAQAEREKRDAQAERDELASELAVAKREQTALVAPSTSVALVTGERRPLAHADVDAMIADLETAVKGVRWSGVGGGVILLLMGAMFAIAASRASYTASVVVGVVFVLWAVRSGAPKSTEQCEAVLAALRDDPRSITRVQKSDNVITIATARDQLIVSVSEPLVHQMRLERHCPDATFVGFPLLPS